MTQDGFLDFINSLVSYRLEVRSEDRGQYTVYKQYKQSGGRVDNAMAIAKEPGAGSY